MLWLPRWINQPEDQIGLMRAGIPTHVMLSCPPPGRRQIEQKIELFVPLCLNILESSCTLPRCS